jgi:F-box/leucine-rich repeat protein 10/11
MDATTASNASTDPSELCPLCTDGQPPDPSAQKAPVATNDDGESELVWIGCTRCRKWYHSVCVLKADGGRESIPSDVLAEYEKDGAWYNWAERLDRW